MLLVTQWHQAHYVLLFIKRFVQIFIIIPFIIILLQSAIERCGYFHRRCSFYYFVFIRLDFRRILASDWRDNEHVRMILYHVPHSCIATIGSKTSLSTQLERRQTSSPNATQNALADSTSSTRPDKNSSQSKPTIK